MKLLAILTLFALSPTALLAQEIEIPQLSDFELPDLSEKLGIDIEIPEQIGFEPSEAIDLLKRAMEIGSSLFSLFKTIWSALSNWIEEITGMSIAELARQLIQVIIDILELIIDIAKQIVSQLR